VPEAPDSSARESHHHRPRQASRKVHASTANLEHVPMLVAVSGISERFHGTRRTDRPGCWHSWSHVSALDRNFVRVRLPEVEKQCQTVSNDER